MPRKNAKRYCVVFGSFFERAKWADSLPGAKRIITKEKPGRKLVTIVDTKNKTPTRISIAPANYDHTYAVINSSGKRTGKISSAEVEKCRK